MRIDVVRGSLLDQDVEVIVNAANTGMRGGGGIDGAIHRLAGPGLMEELREVAPNGAKTGEVVVTGGHASPFQYIFHTPGPIWRGGRNGESQLLATCYRNCMLKANELGVKRLGFCSISTGVYGYPILKASKVAVGTVQETPNDLDLVLFAMFGAEEYAVFRKTLHEMNVES